MTERLWVSLETLRTGVQNFPLCSSPWNSCGLQQSVSEGVVNLFQGVYGAGVLAV